MISDDQKQKIIEFQKNIRKVDRDFDGIFESHRSERRKCRREYLDYIESIGATKADLFEIQNGKKPCCDKCHPTNLRNTEEWISSDGTKEKLKGVSWCNNCGSLIQGDKIFKPWKMQ